MTALRQDYSAIVVGAIVLVWLTLGDGVGREGDATKDSVTDDGARERGAGP